MTDANDKQKPQELKEAGRAQKLQEDRLAHKALPPEIGGVEGPEPTRYGDWERKGRVSDF